MYRYTDNEDHPLKTCPECGHDLTAWGDTGGRGVEVEFYDEGRGNWTEMSCLGVDGVVLDFNGHVSDGLHSTTFCGKCKEQLINMEGVQEDGDYDVDTATYNAAMIRTIAVLAVFGGLGLLGEVGAMALDISEGNDSARNMLADFIEEHANDAKRGEMLAQAIRNTK